MVYLYPLLLLALLLPLSQTGQRQLAWAGLPPQRPTDPPQPCGLLTYWEGFRRLLHLW